MIGTIDVAVEAKSPNLPLFPMRAFVGSPSSIRVRNVPKRVGDWNINRVYVSVIYPDGVTKQADCVQTGGVWVGTIEGSAVAGTCAQGYTVYADGTDENGNAVTGYILGKGDVAILQANGTPEPEPATVFVKLQEDGTDAEDGDLYPTENGYAIQQDGEAHLLGTPFDQITAYVDTQVSSKAEISSVEELANSLSDYYTKSETSSSSEISIALGSKQDNLTPLQLLALSAEIDENKTMLVGGYSNGYYFPVYVDWYGEVTQEMVSDAIDQIAESYRFSIGVHLGTAVSAIGVSAFANTVVSEVYAPQSVVHVKDYAFANSDLRHIKFDYSEGRYTPIVIGDYVFQSCSSLTLADIPADHSINIGVSAFDGCPFTAQNESLYPYYYGLYFNRTDSHWPEVTPGSMPLLPNFPWGLSNTSVIKFGTTASRYWVECQHYGKDTLYATGGITVTGNRPNNRAYWLGVNDNTNTTFTLTATATTQVRIYPTNRTTGKMYNAYLALSADEGITRPFVWYSLSGSYAFDKFQDEYIQNNPIESGKINYYHIYEYQPDHFAVEKLGWAEEQLSAKADVSAIPTKTSQLSNDSGFVVQNGTAVINSLTCDQLVANQAHIVGYATTSDLSAKRDLTDMKVKGVPENDNSASWFTIKYGTTTENAWYYDEGRWESGQTLRVLAAPAAIFSLQKQIEGQWTSLGEFQLDSNSEAAITYEGVTYSITGYIGDLVVSNTLNARLSALEARIAALEGN